MDCKRSSGPGSRKADVKALGRSRKIANPLQAGILGFLSAKPQKGILELTDIPKRYTRYGSLLLLGPTFPIYSQAWSETFNSLTVQSKLELFRVVTQAFKDSSLTHIAINAPIAANRIAEDREEPNEIRSPSGLTPVYGDFGPGSDVCDERYPSKTDLDAAYWTQTIQLKDIVQVWAPRWTMFSRGNISEKSRVLQDGLSKSPFPGLSEVELSQSIDQIDIVDFYVGIGYFAFCYLARGAARVWGWEINGWSVEGLRRGCIQNGWPVRVLKLNEDGIVIDGPTILDLIKEILELEGTPQAIKCIVFWGDNKWASRILNEIGLHMTKNGRSSMLNIRHCNLGLLPTSEGSWKDAVEVLNANTGGWLHVHENVDMSAFSKRQQDIARQLERIATGKDQKSWFATCCHVEQVKTYAPGVVHCVFDISVYPS